MNIGYIFDLNGIVNSKDLEIPFVEGLHCQNYNTDELTVEKIVNFRDKIVTDFYAIKKIEKHLIFFVVNNSKDTIDRLSQCISDIQNDKLHFNTNYDIHVICNFTVCDGYNIREYADTMKCLKNNSVCVFSWFADEYDYDGVMKISAEKRAHTIVRLAYMICKHRKDISLIHVDNEGEPIFNLFGNSAICYDEKDSVNRLRNLYYFKNLQQLLNISDKSIDNYFDNKIIPHINNQKEIDTCLDNTTDDFLKENRISIEATKITERTQSLLLKSSDDDKDYLVSSTTDNLVFIDDLSKKQKWQIDDTYAFMKNYYNEIDHETKEPETTSQLFIKELNDKLTVHKRVKFNEINNEISKKRKEQFDSYKNKTDKLLGEFLNKHDDTDYNNIKELLDSQDVKKHHSNIDYSIAFLDYLAKGSSDYIVDSEVSVSDVCLDSIQRKLELQKRSRETALKESEHEIITMFQNKEDESSPIAKKFEALDKKIVDNKKTVDECRFQLHKWIDPDALKSKWTARTKSVVSLTVAAVIAIVWLVITMYIDSLFNMETRNKIGIGTAIVLMGLVWAYFKYIREVLKKQKAAEKAIANAKNEKKNLMNTCMNKVTDVVEKRYNYMLSFHGLKTINELLDYTYWKTRDLESFRRSVFKQMMHYYLKNKVKSDNTGGDDQNTILLKDTEAEKLLSNSNKMRELPYCFAEENQLLSKSFDEYKKIKTIYETSRFSINLEDIQNEMSMTELDSEIIDAKQDDYKKGISYSELSNPAILPNDSTEVDMDDIRQGLCGDCYFLASLAAIANNRPEFIIGNKGMIEPLGKEHKYFRVKFFNKDGTRFNVDIDNRFWNINDKPCYAGKGNSAASDSYNPWVMAVEKAWAKTNGHGYEGIEGHYLTKNIDYSFALTGESAYSCNTTSVKDKNTLLDTIKQQINNKLPISLYSPEPNNPLFKNTDPYLVASHAYALKSVNDDNTFDIFNPWNNHSDEENVSGKHYKSVDIDFILNNFDTIVFFGVKEIEHDAIERNLTNNARDCVLVKNIETELSKKFDSLGINTRTLGELITTDTLDGSCAFSKYVFNRNRMRDEGSQETIYLEKTTNKTCESANDMVIDYYTNKFRNVEQILRDDDNKCITIFRLSPHYMLSNFHDIK